MSGGFTVGRGRRALRLATCTAGAAALLLSALPGRAVAQARLDDFVVTGGVSWERYDGNFSALTLPAVDSTNRAAAAVGEFGFHGRGFLLDRPGSRLQLNVDGGLRQFAAIGFELRDYAPREWVSRVAAGYGHQVGDLGTLTLGGSYRGRAVADRPPMPLFLQPGYSSFRASGGLRLRPIQGVSFDGELDLEHTDYEAPRLLPQLDLLDRKAQGVEVGAEAHGGGAWSVRFFSGLRFSQYQRQASLDPDDPFRRDRTLNLGAHWRLQSQSSVLATLGVEGTVNRSNSLRPEYDAFSLTGNVSTLLPWWDLSANLYALLVWKTYVHQTPFARLVPGEEADNASVAYLSVTRPLAENLNAVLRFGWTRAETDIGSSYYRRFGTTLLMNFRPGRP